MRFPNPISNSVGLLHISIVFLFRIKKGKLLCVFLNLRGMSLHLLCNSCSNPTSIKEVGMPLFLFISYRYLCGFMIYHNICL